MAACRFLLGQVERLYVCPTSGRRVANAVVYWLTICGRIYALSGGGGGGGVLMGATALCAANLL